MSDFLWALRAQAISRAGFALDRYRVRRLRALLDAMNPDRRREREQPPRLFVDLTVIARHHGGTGVQRVAEQTIEQLLLQAPDRVVPIAAGRGGYVELEWKGRNHEVVGPVEPQPGDMFLGLDLSLDGVYRHQKLLAAWKARGVRLWFVLYDLLPCWHAEWFSSKLVVRYRRWLAATMALADGIYVISEPVGEEVRDRLRPNLGVEGSLQIQTLPLGWEIPARRVIAVPSRSPYLLMVGTVEPRKGYDDALDAMELLWERGSSWHLQIVGRPGWKTASLQRRLSQHPELGCRLHWSTNLSDDELETVYAGASGLLFASRAEGFGLPILEARARRLPVMARDLPVFRWQAGEAIAYFPEHADQYELADKIDAWLASGLRLVVTLEHEQLPSWADTASMILKAVDM